MALNKNRKSPIAGRDEETRSVRWALGSLALSMLMSSLGISIANVALPTLAQTFTASFQEVQWVVLAYLLAITITIVGAGRLGDILGKRPIQLAGIALFTVATALCGIAPSLWLLIVARAIQGLGAAILIALTVALVRETVPRERTGSAMGLLGTMSAIGTALGPALGGILIAGPGWRAIFLIMVPLGLLNYVLAHRTLPSQAPRGKGKSTGFDSLGALLLGLTLVAFALVVTVGGGHFDWLNWVLLLATVVGVGLFVLSQTRTPSPLIPLAAFRNVALSASLAMNALVAAVMMATLVVGPFFLSLALGLNATTVGIIMSIGPLIATLSGVPAGRMVDHAGAPRMVIVGLALMAAGSIAVSILPARFGVAGYIAGIAVLTPGYQLFQAANNTAVMMDATLERRGLISGMLSLSRNLGLITGASVMGAVFAFASSATYINTAHAENIATGLRVTFAIAAVLVVVSIAIAIGSRIATTHSSLSAEDS